ncbi:MAG: DNRLRE domain-containing protein [Phycisphaerae bacterium]|nr:DNRLRE domain-containing protein [Phycisphaerae bacterium]
MASAFLCLLLRLAPVVQGYDTITIPADRDTFCSGSAPDSNFGTWTSWQFGLNAANIRTEIALVHFDLSLIPQGRVIQEARLRLFCGDVYYNDMSTAFCFMSSGGWSETTATWNSMPGVIATPYSSFDPQGGWNEIGVSTIVKEWYAGHQNNYGFQLRSQTYGGPSTALFRSREYSGTTYDPKLEVDIITPTNEIVINNNVWLNGSQQNRIALGPGASVNGSFDCTVYNGR